MSTAKISLSQYELEVVSNADLILTKNAIIHKITQLFQQLQVKQQTIIQRHAFPGDVLTVPYKISRGENYKGLPWLVLDHPRWFSQENIFAIRTLFWWGKYFSTTLHLAGEQKNIHGDKVFASFQSLAENDFYLCTGDDQWQHHFEEDYYTSCRNILPGELKNYREKSFLKIASKVEIGNVESAMEKLERDYEVIVKIVCQ